MVVVLLLVLCDNILPGNITENSYQFVSVCVCWCCTLAELETVVTEWSCTTWTRWQEFLCEEGGARWTRRRKSVRYDSILLYTFFQPTVYCCWRSTEAKRWQDDCWSLPSRRHSSFLSLDAESGNRSVKSDDTVWKMVNYRLWIWNILMYPMSWVYTHFFCCCQVHDWLMLRISYLNYNC